MRQPMAAVVAAAGAMPPAELHPSRQHRRGDKATVLSYARAPGPCSLSNAALWQLPTRRPGTQRSVVPGRAAKHLLGSSRSLSTEPLPCLARPFLHGTSLLAAPIPAKQPSVRAAPCHEVASFFLSLCPKMGSLKTAAASWAQQQCAQSPQPPSIA